MKASQARKEEFGRNGKRRGRAAGRGDGDESPQGGNDQFLEVLTENMGRA